MRTCLASKEESRSMVRSVESEESNFIFLDAVFIICNNKLFLLLHLFNNFRSIQIKSPYQ